MALAAFFKEEVAPVREKRNLPGRELQNDKVINMPYGWYP